MVFALSRKSVFGPGYTYAPQIGNRIKEQRADMNRKASPDTPATIGDVQQYTNAGLFMTGQVIGRVLPVFLRNPVTDQASLDRLIEALKALGNELAKESPVFSVQIMDGIIGELLDNPHKAFPDVT